MSGKPPAEIEITDELVRTLVVHQHPDLGRLPLQRLASGWDNEVFRLGTTMAVRLPRREIAAQLVLNEQKWLPLLARRLPIPIPAPLRTGAPTADYPWHWSIVPWFEGVCADRAAPSSDEVDVLGEFLLKLHAPAPIDAPKNAFRGIPIQDRAATTEERIGQLKARTDVITPAIEEIWAQGLSAPASSQARWLHGDLHAQNVLVADGRLSAIIDWGDVTAGDVATDLPVIWGLFDSPGDRRRLLEIYGPDQATYQRAKAWTVLFGVVLAYSGLINSPRHAVQGQLLLSRLNDDA